VNVTLDNILITGGAGFVGHHFVRQLRLCKPACRITVVDNLRNPCKGFDIEQKNTAISFYKEDIRNPETLSDIVKRERINTCIHLAALTSVVDSIVNPFETTDVNAKGTLSVFEACAKNNVKSIIFASSAAVYGNPKVLPIPEDHPIEPISPYGATKVAGEALLSSYKSSGKIKNAVSLRFFNIYGEGQNSTYAGVITRFTEQLSKGLAPIIYGTGEQTRDFISVHDVVKAIILFAENNVSGVFNIGTGKPLSLNELAKKMILASNLDLEPIYKSAQQGDILHSYADTTKSKHAINFTAFDTIESYLK
jgi:UDP-glucose 4-epimerase